MAQKSLASKSSRVSAVPAPVPDRAIEVTDALHDKRLDYVVSHALPGISRAEARRLILQGAVRLNGRPVSIFARTVRRGDRLVVAAGSAAAASAPDRIERLTFLYEDDDLLVIDKPAHLLSERTAGERAVSVPDVLLRMGYGESFLVHRLDAGTSGAMIVARTSAAAERLTQAFKRKEVHKTYWLMCEGLLVDEGEFAGPIGRDHEHLRRFCVRPEGSGQHALTRYRPLSRSPEAQLSLVQAMPITGRTHQIRVHFAHAGHRLLGDRLYQGASLVRLGEQTLLPKRALLHARILEFKHPWSGQTLQFQSPLPEDFGAALRLLFPHFSKGLTK